MATVLTNASNNNEEHPWFQDLLFFLEAGECTDVNLEETAGFVFGDEEMRRLILASVDEELRICFSFPVRHLTERGMELLASWLNMSPVVLTLSMGFDSQSSSLLPCFLAKLHPRTIRFVLWRVRIDPTVSYTEEQAHDIQRFFATNSSLQSMEITFTSDNTLRANEPSFLTSFLGGLRTNQSLDHITIHFRGGWPNTVYEAPHVRSLQLYGSLDTESLASFLSPWTGLHRLAVFNCLLPDDRLKVLFDWITQHTSIKLARMSQIEGATLDGFIRMLPQVLLGPLQEIYMLARSDHAFGVLDEKSALALGRLLARNDSLRTFGLRVGGCTQAGAAMLARFVPAFSLERLLLSGPLTVQHAGTLEEAIRHNFRLVEVRDLGTDDDVVESIGRIRVNLAIQRVVLRNKRWNDCIAPLVRNDHDILWPHVLHRLSELGWHDILYMTCREHILHLLP